MPHRTKKIRWTGIVAVSLLAVTSQAAFAEEVPPTMLDLPHALAIARGRSPLLQAARHRIGEAHGDLTGASILLVANPEVGIAAGPRLPGRAGESRTPEVEVGLAQRLEIGGQRGYRIERASEELQASRADADDADRVVSLAVATSFFAALAATERTRLTEENEGLARDLLTVASARVRQGAEGPIVLNAARIRLAEARRRSIEARAELAAAGLALARILGLPPTAPLTLAGALPGAGHGLPVNDLVAQALESRPDVVALSRRARGAGASVHLATATAWPDLTLGVRYGVDQKDRLWLATAGIALPLFARNQGERERSRATVLRLDAELAGLRLGVEEEIRQAHARFEAAVAALAVYDADVLQAQEESLILLRSAYEAGKVEYTQMALLQRELLEGRLGYLEARLALARAEAGLRAAAGLELAFNPTDRGGKP